MQKLSLVCDALRNRDTVQFFTYVLESSYSTHFLDAKGIRVLNAALELLIQSQKPSASISRLRNVGMYCHDRIYRNKENTWLMKRYATYKSKLKVEHNYQAIKRWIHGKSVLDFGSGDGYFAHHLCQKGYNVWGTDVQDYRSLHVKDFPLISLPVFSRANAISDRFDTTVVNSVLHHIEKRSIDTTLCEIHKHTKKRIIIKEDIYLTEHEFTSLGIRRMSDLTRAYMNLSNSQRMQFLALMDFYGNYVVQGIFSMNLPLQFYSLDQWRPLLEKHKIIVRHTVPQLFDTHMVHTGPQMWLICDVI